MATINSGKVLHTLAPAALHGLGLVLTAVGAVLEAGSRTSRREEVGHVRTGAGIEPAAIDEDGQLVGAKSGSPAIESVRPD